MVEFLGHENEVGVNGIRVEAGGYRPDEERTDAERMAAALWHYGSAALEDALEDALEEEIAALERKAADYARVILREWADRMDDEGAGV